LLILFVISEGKKIAIQVRSEGCEDRGRKNGCGLAKITVNNRDYSKHGRGYNFAVLSGNTGTQYTFLIITLRVDFWPWSH
jgi:hypothetical protein